MYTNDDLITVINYNNTAHIFRITPAKRIVWDMRNANVAHLNSVLSKQIITEADFKQLKKQVRFMLMHIAIHKFYAQHAPQAA